MSMPLPTQSLCLCFDLFEWVNEDTNYPALCSGLQVTTTSPSSTLSSVSACWGALG